LVSSYFSPGSIDRKGALPYLWDRLKRLGIPLLFYMLIIVPEYSMPSPLKTSKVWILFIDLSLA